MQNIRPPALEKVTPGFGSSFTVKHLENTNPKNLQPFWHFHPEIEMVYVKGGSGKRHIGGHLSYYHDGDLVLIGSNLPHRGFTDSLTGNESETIIQFTRECFGANFFDSDEMKDISNLLLKAKSGMAFYGSAKEKIGGRIEGLSGLDNFAKFIELLCILQDMAWTEEYEILNADGYTLEIENSDNDRINVVFDFVQANFHRAIKLDEIADLANMAVPSFCRYFKRVSGKKFTRFVNEIRIVHACKLLGEKQMSVADICYESGFNNFSHFNKLFKEITGKSPTIYRKEISNVL